MTWLRPLTLVTGILIAGEALALLVGMHLLSGSGNTWVSAKNDRLIGLDIIACAFLLRGVFP